MEDAGLLPGQCIPLADLVGSELLGGIEAAAARFGGQAEPTIASGTGEEVDAIQRLAEQGAVAETGVANGQNGA